MTELTGRCGCGRLRWRAPGPVLWAGHCHCDSCRRASSAPLTSFFGVARDSVTWEGQLRWRDSSPGTRRGFCPDCGSQMSYQSTRWPDETHLYAASLDDPGAFVPTAHYHWDERVDWLDIRDNLTRHARSADAGAIPDHPETCQDG